MELGETICLPNISPKCELCPLKKLCLARIHQTQDDIPRKISKKEKIVENLTVLLMIVDGKIAIRKREDHGLLKNMWEFPNVVGEYSKEEIIKYLKLDSKQVLAIQESIETTHVFTHKKWCMKSYIIQVEKPLKEYNWVNYE